VNNYTPITAWKLDVFGVNRNKHVMRWLKISGDDQWRASFWKCGR